jgi:hypothetical protein
MDNGDGESGDTSAGQRRLGETRKRIERSLDAVGR